MSDAAHVWTPTCRLQQCDGRRPMTLVWVCMEACRQVMGCIYWEVDGTSSHIGLASMHDAREGP